MERPARSISTLVSSVTFEHTTSRQLKLWPHLCRCGFRRCALCARSTRTIVYLRCYLSPCPPLCRFWINSLDPEFPNLFSLWPREFVHLFCAYGTYMYTFFFFFNFWIKFLKVFCLIFKYTSILFFTINLVMCIYLFRTFLISIHILILLVRTIVNKKIIYLFIKNKYVFWYLNKIVNLFLKFLYSINIINILIYINI